MDRDVDTSVLTALSSRTLSERIAEKLREAIMNDRLRPGQRLVERELAEAMQTSRGPVRDALRLLENEGLVVRSPHRGSFVSRLTLQDAEEIYSLREAIELLLIDHGLRNATSEQIDKLEGICDSMDSQVSRGDYSQAEATDLDLTFHRELSIISGHKRAIAVWEVISAQIRMLLLSHKTIDPGDWRDRGVLWHRRIVDALRQRDRDLAHQLIREHVAASFDRVADRLKKSQGSDYA